jgi:DNA invertase Pin-like site-specific DNA recombinase
MLPANSSVWAYSRDSGGEDQDIGDQNRYIRQYCQEHDLILSRLFCDEASPGSSTAGREQFEDMMALARKLPAEDLPAGLILWSFARFARDFDDAQFYKAALRRRGLSIISLADDVPQNGPHARLVEAVVDWKNDQFLKDLSKNVKRGLRDVALQGYAPGGFPPVGYKAEDVRIGTKRNGEPRIVQQWVPDPETAPLVKRAWAMRASGASYHQILRETGVLNTTASLSYFFRNKTYLGIRKCRELEVEDAHEPLIDRRTWDAVQDTLREPVKRGESWPEGSEHPRRRNSPYLLSGLARCLYCGAAMSGGRGNVNTRPHAWRYYLCGRKKRRGWGECIGGKVSADPIEAAVLEAVREKVLTPAYTEKLVEVVNSYLAADTAGLDAQIKQARSAIAKADEAIDNLLDLAERYGSEAAGDRIVEREQEKRRLERDLRSLLLRKERAGLRIEAEVLNDVVAQSRDELALADVQARRELLKCYVDKVEIGKDRGRLWYTFPIEDMLEEATGLWQVPPRGLYLKDPQSIALTWAVL